MKKNEFEQQIETLRLRHDHALAELRVRHEHAMEELSARHAHTLALNAHQIEVANAFGAEIRQTISHAKDMMMPLYEHLGSEQTFALLKLQLEQSVAMVSHLGEKALAVAEKKVEADASAKLSRNIEDIMKVLLREVERVYFAGQEDSAEGTFDDADFASFARDLGYTHPNDPVEEGADDDDLVS